MRVTASSTPLRMAMRGIDDDARRTPPSSSASARSRPSVADIGRRGDAQAAALVLAGVGIFLRLLDVLDRDQTDAAIVLVHHQQLLDAVLVEEPLGFLERHVLAHGDEVVLGHQLAHALTRVGRRSARRGW